MNRKSPARLLMIFVDGLGMGASDPARNPVRPETCPCLCELIAGASGIDACLGVAGLPQSATGQTALLTGVNAPRAMGRHVEGFPGPELVKIIEARGIFRQLTDRGISSTFANGYLVENSDEAAAARIKSVTTVAALTALGRVRNRAQMDRGEAVCHDLTRLSLVDRGYCGPQVEPELAAEHLLNIASKYRFTLFEFFETDRAGHRSDAAMAASVLRKLDLFLERLLCKSACRDDLSLVLTSDHGNIEDLGVGVHTCNPVPFAVTGNAAPVLSANVSDLTDVTPAIVEYLGSEMEKS